MIIDVPCDRIDDFRRTWPDSSLHDLDRLIITTDSKRWGGDMVDLDAFDYDGYPLDLEAIDGPALAALVADEVNGYRVRNNSGTPSQRTVDGSGEQWIEFLCYSIEISSDPADDAEGWIEFDIWDAHPERSGDFIASDVVRAEDWRSNGPAALRAWAIAAAVAVANA